VDGREDRRRKRRRRRLYLAFLGLLLVGFVVLAAEGSLLRTGLFVFGALVIFETILLLFDRVLMEGEAGEAARRGSGEKTMAAEANLHGKWRLIYGLAGLGLMAWGFFGLKGSWLGTALPLAGGWVLLEALVGWSVANAILGIGGPKE
jgi:hypothetical protein